MSTTAEISLHEEEQVQDRYTFGFWVYLMTDLVMFAVLFASFAVLRNNTFGGPSGKDLFDLSSALLETLVLLTSSFTCGLVMLAVNRNKPKQVIGWFAVTFLLGVIFLTLELTEFSKFFALGATPQRSAFLSAFFTLVGTHGLHITFGLLWMAVAMLQVKTKGLSPFVISKITRLSLFWH